MAELGTAWVSKYEGSIGSTWGLTYVWNDVAEPRLTGQQAREPLCSRTLSVLFTIVYHVLCAVRSVSNLNPTTTRAGVKHTLQVHTSLRRRQRKPVQFRPSFCVEVSFSGAFGADSKRNQPSASGPSNVPAIRIETHGA